MREEAFFWKETKLTVLAGLRTKFKIKIKGFEILQLIPRKQRVIFHKHKNEKIENLKVARLKISIWKSIAFLYTNSKQFQMEIKQPHL